MNAFSLSLSREEDLLDLAPFLQENSRLGEYILSSFPDHTHENEPHLSHKWHKITLQRVIIFNP